MTRYVLCLFFVAACSSRSTPPPPTAPPGNAYEQAHVLKSYRVPAGHEKTLERLLRGTSYPVQVVSDKGTQTQFVRLNPQVTGDGHFVLSAPSGIHDGVRELVEQLQKAPAKKGPSTIETTHWIVLAWPSKELAIPAELSEPTNALKALTESLGPMRFELLDKVQIAAIDGEEATAHSSSSEVRETASVDGDAINLRLMLKIAGGKSNTGLETAVAIKPGQYAVLGQAGYMPEKPSLTAGQAGPATLLFVVRARTLP